MSAKEGIIKFRMEYTPAAPLPAEELRELNAWRRILVMLKLLGQDPTRYSGWGFGNVSRRLEPFDAPPEQRRYVITGTQTGAIADLRPEHFVVVTECHPAQNTTVAEGPVQPSSESMTHGAVYAADCDIRWVMHVHSPEIWRNAAALGLPITDPAIPYGTPEMSAAVLGLFATTDVCEQRIFSMGGHEDGIVSFGRTAEEAGIALLSILAKALYV